MIKMFKMPLRAAEGAAGEGGNTPPAQEGLLNTPPTEKPAAPENTEIPANTDPKVNPPQKIAAPEALENKEWWDEEKGALKGEVILEEYKKQAEIAKGLRQKLSKGVNIPAKPEDYKITPAEGLEAFIDVKQPIFGDIKTLAHSLNLSDEQLGGFINGYMKLMVDKKIVSAPKSEEDTAKEKADFLKAERSKLGDKADGLITSAKSFIDTEYKKGIFTESEKNLLSAIADKDAAGIMLVNKIREMAGQPFIPVDNASVDTLPSDRELLSKWKDFSESEQMDILQQRIKLGRPAKFG